MRVETTVLHAEMAGRSKRSGVWEYFEKTDSKHVKCSVCNKSFAYHGGTSNLRSHLADVHNIDLERKCATGTSTSATSNITAFCKPKVCSKLRINGTNDHLVEFIARDLRPISVVNGIGFKRLIAWLEPGYVVPSATCVTKLVRAKFCDGRERLIALLRDEVGVSLTTD